MELYLLEPEVSGGHGVRTEYEINKEARPKVLYLHYEFDGWLGDELLESTPCFIISKELDNKLSKLFKNDYITEDCLITKSEEFEEFSPYKDLPEFIRFIPLGAVKVVDGLFSNWSRHHFCLSQREELVVTNEALKVLKQLKIDNCDITPLTISK